MAYLKINIQASEVFWEIVWGNFYFAVSRNKDHLRCLQYKVAITEKRR